MSLEHLLLSWYPSLITSDYTPGLLISRPVVICSGSEAGSFLRLMDSCVTQRKAQGPSRTCDESKEEEEEDVISGASAVSARGA